MCATDKIAEAVPAFCPEPVRALPPKQRGQLAQLYQLRQRHRLDRDTAAASVEASAPPGDWLAASTACSRRCAQKLFSLVSSFSADRRYSRSIPSARTFVNAISISAILVLLCNLIVKLTSEPNNGRSKTWTVMYLSSFAIHFGAQVWMTMVSGLVLYFTLPRHVFGSVQEKLFPAFYTFSTVMSFIQAISFINTQRDMTLWSRSFIQVLCMFLTFAIELFIQLYVAKPIVMLKHIKTQMEASVGCGQEIGKHVLGELANCPHYMKILGRFRRLHSYTAIATIVTVMCSAYHVNYLAERICV